MIVRTLGLAAFLATTALAQTPTPTASPYATIRGYVFDSLLTGATLPAAAVSLTGPVARSTVADPRGRFGFDSLPPGQYTITFNHPTLDNVGYAPPEKVLDLRAGVLTRLFLSTAASTAMYQRLCPATTATDLGVLVGSLREVTTRRLLGGGEIRVEWLESQLSQELGFTHRTRAVGATTDSLGRFRICGLPTGRPMMLKARHQGVDGAPLELNFGGRSLAIRPISIDVGDTVATAPGAPTIAAAARHKAVLKGTVRKEGGDPLSGAQVLVLGSSAITEVTASGAFQLDSLPGGTHMVEIRAIGFDRRREAVELNPDQPATLDVRMKQVATIIQELNVTAKAAESEFDTRKARNNGGYFITADDIERRNTLRTEDLFRAVPGLNVVPSGGFDYQVVSSRGVGISGKLCSPDFFIDGVRTEVDPQIAGGIPANPSDIYGIEVYNSAILAPAEYQTQGSCGVIAIWTKRGQTRKKR